MQAEKIQFKGNVVHGNTKKELLINANLNNDESLLYFNHEKDCYEVLDNQTLEDIFHEEMIFGEPCIICGNPVAKEISHNMCAKCENESYDCMRGSVEE